jgi:hypothetical protein
MARFAPFAAAISLLILTALAAALTGSAAWIVVAALLAILVATGLFALGESGLTKHHLVPQGQPCLSPAAHKVLSTPHELVRFVASLAAASPPASSSASAAVASRRRSSESARAARWRPAVTSSNGSRRAPTTPTRRGRS